MQRMALLERYSRTFRQSPSISKLLVVIALSGGGGFVAYSEATRQNSANIVYSTEPEIKKKKVVVLGTGWAGTSFLKNLKDSSYDVQVISPRNYFAFTPLLPSVTSGTVEPRSIVEPIRNIIRKEVEDAQKIRKTIIDCFERAALPSLSDEERKKILHFVVVGGGPTGVEFAAQLHDFLTEDLAKLYPIIKDLVRITLLEATDHILNMFDKRITAFAEEKFKREGIDLRTGSMVVNISDKEISTKEIKTGEMSSMPYGMIVWSTGIGTRPVIMDFMKQIGQSNRRVLATDEWLRVEGCDNIYAVGDCATIIQRKVMEDVAAIFQKADKDNSGTLTVKEFQEVLDDVCERYPQLELYLKNKQMHSLVDLLKDSKGDDVKESIEVRIEEFKSALSQVDLQMKNLPATAQVASQQGVYLANCFNRMKEVEKNPEGPLRVRGEGRHRFHPFRYKWNL